MAIIFFDSWCALCHWAVKFTSKRDTLGQFVYAPLTGETAKEKLGAWLKTHPDVDSIVLLDEKGEICWYSKAVFTILWKLGFPWSLVGILHVLPKALLVPFDLVYRLVAKHRSRSCDITGIPPKDGQFLP